MTGPRALLLGSLLLCLGCSGTEETPVFGPGPQVWAGCDPAWSVVHPASGSERLLAACALPGGEAWAVGTGGVVVHHVGQRWRRENTGTDATLADVATDGRLVCAVGSDGTILVREGAAWRREASGTAGTLRAVAVAADGAAWAGGEGGVLLQRAPEGWRGAGRPDASDVTALAAMGDTMVVGYASGQVIGMAAGQGRTLASFGGLGVLGLAVSPSGTLFAAADSLYRYDSGRWVALRNISDRRLAANDSLVFCGMRAFRHDGTGSWFDPFFYVRVPDPLVAVCPVGPAGALAVGLYGAFSWLREGAWLRDLGGGYTGQIVGLADGTACGVVDRRVIAWDDDCWRVVSFPDGDVYQLFDGQDATHLLLRVASGLVLAGPTGQTAVPSPPVWPYQMLVDSDGALVGRDRDGIIAWTGREWRREISVDEGTEAPRLSRTRAGELFAVNSARVMRRAGGRWRNEARLVYPGAGSWPYSYIYQCGKIPAGRFPDAFVLVGGDYWLNWDARADSVQGDWRLYDPPLNQVRVSVFCEAAGAVYVLDSSANRVLRMRFESPETRSWEAVTGAGPDQITALRIEPDGAITAFASSTGRVWRHPGPHLF